MKSKVPRVITSSTLGEKKIKIYKIWWYDLNKYSWSKWFATDVNTCNPDKNNKNNTNSLNSIQQYIEWMLKNVRSMNTFPEDLMPLQMQQ